MQDDVVPNVINVLEMATLGLSRLQKGLVHSSLQFPRNPLALKP
jgi:hypothetical protein